MSAEFRSKWKHDIHHHFSVFSLISPVTVLMADSKLFNEPVCNQEQHLEAMG